MKTILVATDFSTAGHNACLYGAKLAKSFNAKLLLFHAYEQMVVAAEVALIIDFDSMRKRAQAQLDSEAFMVDRQHQTIVESICAEGPVANKILEAADNNDVDLIVVGMKSTGKGLRRLIGSTVTALARRSDIPIIVVPDGLAYKRIDTIVMANESDLELEADVHVLDALREIAEKFQSKLYLARVVRNSFREAFEVFDKPRRLIKKLMELDPVYETIPGKDIPQALHEFIDKHDAQLLALLPHRHSLLERMFIKSVTRSVIFDTDIPLLIMTSKKFL
jgi:nucleotide-binding universal stress UspA family protein